MQRYFETVQKELLDYDCILYEMVASRESLENRRNPADTKKLKSSRSRGFNILGCIQRQMARILMLDFQLDCLDYQAENWYHADLDYETFKLLQVTHLCFSDFSLFLLVFRSYFRLHLLIPLLKLILCTKIWLGKLSKILELLAFLILILLVG